ncbi:uncharacterized protein J3R85_011650 [Psidium guajava]|nr:uncharacterized protein J3R85_011650 [Psidium guajava]
MHSQEGMIGWTLFNFVWIFPPTCVKKDWEKKKVDISLISQVSHRIIIISFTSIFLVRVSS